MAMLVAVVAAMLAIVMLAGTAYAHTDESEYEVSTMFEEPTRKYITQVPEVIRWSISDEISSDARWHVEELYEPRDMELVVSIIKESFDIWEDHNPELNFEMIPEDGDIEVGLVMELRRGIGFALPNYDYTGEIYLSLGLHDCRGEYNEYVSGSLTHVMMHEIGHILGLGHIVDPEHLMHGIDMFTQDPFDDLGFNIPDIPIPKNHANLMGKEEIKARVDAIEQEWVDLTAQYDEPYPPDVWEFLVRLTERESTLWNAWDCMDGTLPEDYGTLDQRVALLYDDVAILDAKLTSIQTTLNTINTSIDAILDRLVALETDTSGLTPPTPEPTPPPTPEPTPIIGIEGKIYNDSNNNDILDAGESGIPNRTVLVISLANPSDVNRLTSDSNGDYSIKLDAKSGWLVQVEGTNVYSYTTVQSAFTTVVNLGL